MTEATLRGQRPPQSGVRFSRFLNFYTLVTATVVLSAAVYWSLLIPILISIFLAWLFLPLVDRLEKWKVPRLVSVVGIVVLFPVIIGLVVTWGSPVLYRQGVMLVQLLPQAAHQIVESWIPWLAERIAALGIMNTEEVRRVFDVANLLAQLQAELRSGIAGIWETGASLVEGAVNLILIPLLVFFLLKDYRTVTDALWSLVPRDVLPSMRNVTQAVGKTLKSVLKGQAIVAGILMVLYVIGFNIVGLQFAVAIGVVAGMFRVIPYFDVIVGGILCGLVMVSDFQGWGQALGVGLVFLIVQAIDGAFVTPAVIGDRIGIHPVIIVLSLFAFASWFGFWGVLLAIPVTATFRTLLTIGIPFYKNSRYYRGFGGGPSGQRPRHHQQQRREGQQQRRDGQQQRRDGQQQRRDGQQRPQGRRPERGP